MKKLFFMHIPKCGGTSIKKALREAYRGSSVFNIDAHASKYSVEASPGGDGLHAFRDKLVLYAMSTGRYSLIMGHSVYNPKMVEDFSDEYQLVTLVRDPVSRFLSHYFYNRYKDSTHFKIDDDFKSFLDSSAAEELGRFYVKYFCGLAGQKSVDLAIENARKFHVVGSLDELELFSRRLKDAFSIDVSFDHQNRNPVAIKDQLLDASGEELEKVNQLVSDDMTIYRSVFAGQ